MSLYQRFGNRKIVTPGGSATMEFDRGLQKMFDKIEGQIADLSGIVADIQALQATQATQLADIEALQTQQAALIADLADKQAQLDAHQTELDSQLAQIIAAQDAADLAHRNDSISSSWTSPGTILSASDTGTNAKITVAAHVRKYGDGTSQVVNSSFVGGLAYGTAYQVYYDDPNRAGGAVTYHAITNPNNALPNAASGRHFCGTITTPSAGAPATDGGVSPPSAGGQIDFTQTP